MDYKAKIIDLDIDHNLGLQAEELGIAEAKLLKAKADFETDAEWLSALESIVLSTRNDPLKQEIQRNAIALSQICPLCKNVCEPITLMSNKQAYYCKTHRVVMPAAVNP